MSPEISVPIEKIVNLGHLDIHGSALAVLGGVIPVTHRGSFSRRHVYKLRN